MRRQVATIFVLAMLLAANSWGQAANRAAAPPGGWSSESTSAALGQQGRRQRATARGPDRRPGAPRTLIARDAPSLHHVAERIPCVADLTPNPPDEATGPDELGAQKRQPRRQHDKRRPGKHDHRHADDQ